MKEETEGSLFISSELISEYTPSVNENIEKDNISQRDPNEQDEQEGNLHFLEISSDENEEKIAKSKFKSIQS